MSKLGELWGVASRQGMRPLVRATIYLDPAVAANLHEAQAKLGLLRSRAAEGHTIKDSIIADAANAVEVLEARALEAQAVLVLRPPSAVDLAVALQDLDDKASPVEGVIRRLGAAFVQVETLDGVPAEDIDRAAFIGGLRQMTEGQLMALYRRLDEAEVEGLPR